MEAAKIIAELFDGYVTCIDQKEPDGFYACVKMGNAEIVTFLKFKDAMDHIYYRVESNNHIEITDLPQNAGCEVAAVVHGERKVFGTCDAKDPLHARRIAFLRAVLKMKQQGLLN